VSELKERVDWIESKFFQLRYKVEDLEELINLYGNAFREVRKFLSELSELPNVFFHLADLRLELKQLNDSIESLWMEFRRLQARVDDLYKGKSKGQT